MNTNPIEQTKLFIKCSHGCGITDQDKQQKEFAEDTVRLALKSNTKPLSIIVSI